MSDREVVRRKTGREREAEEAESRGDNYDWDTVISKVADPARKPREAARAAVTEGTAPSVDELADAAYERRRVALAAAMAAARTRGAGEAAIASAIDRAIDSGSDLATEVGLVGLQG